MDTSDPAVMLQAIGAGADIVNDVRGLSREGACDMVADLECPVVIMHSRGTPDTMTQTMNELTSYNDVLAEISTELQIRIDKAMDAGIRQEKLSLILVWDFQKIMNITFKLCKIYSKSFSIFRCLCCLVYPASDFWVRF